MKRRASRLALLSLFVLSLFSFGPKIVAQQGNQAAASMTQIIYGLQTGVMNWNRFYPNAKQVIAMQTGGTGRYDQLASLGPVTYVQQTGGWMLPAGFFYYFRSFFQGGTVDWQIASDFQGNILSLSFMPVNQVTPVGQPASQPSSTPQITPVQVQGGTNPPSPRTKSDACSKFPDLCPQNQGG